MQRTGGGEGRGGKEPCTAEAVGDLFTQEQKTFWGSRATRVDLERRNNGGEIPRAKRGPKTTYRGWVVKKT